MAMARLAAIILAGSSGGVIGAESARRNGAEPGTPASAPPPAPRVTLPPSDETPSNLVLRRSADGMFYTDAQVNGTTVRFLIDTGASVVVLTPADARRIGLQGTGGAFGARMETAGGGAAMRWATLKRLQIGTVATTGVRAAILQDNLRVSLLGQSALTQLGKITIAGDRLSLHHGFIEN